MTKLPGLQHWLGAPVLALLMALLAPWAGAAQTDEQGTIETLDRGLEEINAQLREKVAELHTLLADREDSSFPVLERDIAEQQSHDFQRDIRPLLERKCVACHACYDAPCQLKMDAPGGLERGASRIAVYDGLRLRDIPPTRLGVDAQGVAGWREKGFFDVLASPDGEGRALLAGMIDLGRRSPVPRDAPIPDDMQLGLKRDHACPTPSEFQDYAIRNPHGGMPLAVAGLTDAEYAMLSTWLEEGARVDAAELAIPAPEQALIDRWEAWFNDADERRALVSRYLFEHLFLAHLYLDEHAATEKRRPERFYRLVRSATPPGEAIVPVAAVRPNSPTQGPFWYRLQPLLETIVHKTHITYAFGPERLARYETLFLSDEWALEALPGYDEVARANPFETFAALPAGARYQFLLDDADFFVRNFIRGPVCRGQIATDVIRDRFWVMFEDPSSDLYVNDPDHRSGVSSKLGVPGQKSSLLALGPEWIDYRSDRAEYVELRREHYRERFPEGARLEHIWDGDGSNPSAFLTIFRHHDSATIVRGWHGDLPLTAWLMDYPLLERTFYELVVGFNVFGSVAHQAQTRLYFDFIRHESESNFLRLLPPAARVELHDAWYQDSAHIKTLITYPEVDSNTPTAIRFTSDRPGDELLTRLLDEYPALTGVPDNINRDTTPESGPMTTSLARLAATPLADLPVVEFFPDATFLIVDAREERRVFTVLRDRRHSNVAFMLGESLRYEPERDELTVMPRPLGSYPNLMLRASAEDLPQLVQTLVEVDSAADFEAVLDRWGVRRMDPAFWDSLHAVSEVELLERPVEAGIYDINRYGRY